MRRGRPPGVFLDPDQDGLPAIQIAGAEIDANGHTTIPPKIGQAVGWLDYESKQDVLAVLSQPGLVELHAWNPHGVEVIKRKKELEARLKSDPITRDTLIQLTLRYRRLVVAKEFQSNFPVDVRLHLGIRQPIASRIYVLQVASRIEIFVKEILESRLSEKHDDLADLP